jgi:hypothetical protein
MGEPLRGESCSAEMKIPHQVGLKNTWCIQTIRNNSRVSQDLANVKPTDIPDPQLILNTPIRTNLMLRALRAA